MIVKVGKYETIVDERGKDLLTTRSFYWAAGHDGCSYLQSRQGYFHRLLIGAKKGEIVDHINQNTRDNRLCNLRIVTHALSNKNRGLNKNNTSGTKYIAWHKQRSKWRVYGFKDFKQTSFGLFATFAEAEVALVEAKKTNPALFSC